MGIPDKSRMGRSQAVPFIPGEHPMDRHERRLATNLSRFMDAAYRYCQDKGILFDVKNEGQHWIFRLDDGRIVEWWPSSAKCVVNKRWNKGIHAHDWMQVKAVIEKVIANP